MSLKRKVRIGARYKKEHTILRKNGVYEEMNPVLDSYVENKLQLAFIIKPIQKRTLWQRLFG